VNTHQNTISNRSDGALAPTPQQTSTIHANFNTFLQANVQFMTVMATKMPFIGRG